MVGLRIVEVDGALDEAQPEEAHVEVQVPLGIGGDRRDVMNAEHACHGSGIRGDGRPALEMPDDSLSER